MRANPELDATLDELAKHRIAAVVQTGRKHIKVRFNWNGREKIIVVSSTPSDGNAPENCRRTVRHVLGVEREVVKSARPKKHRKVLNTRVTAAPKTITAGRDPWEAFQIERDCLAKFPGDKAFALKVATSCRRIEAAGHQAAQRIAGIRP